MQELDYMLKHVNPTGDGLLQIQQAVFHDFPAAEVHIFILQRVGVKFLFSRLEVRLRTGPDLKRPVNHFPVSLLQFR